MADERLPSAMLCRLDLSLSISSPMDPVASTRNTRSSLRALCSSGFSSSCHLQRASFWPRRRKPWAVWPSRGSPSPGRAWTSALSKASRVQPDMAARCRYAPSSTAPSGERTCTCASGTLCGPSPVLDLQQVALADVAAPGARHVRAGAECQVLAEVGVVVDHAGGDHRGPLRACSAGDGAGMAAFALSAACTLQRSSGRRRDFGLGGLSTPGAPAQRDLPRAGHGAFGRLARFGRCHRWPGHLVGTDRPAAIGGASAA